MIMLSGPGIRRRHFWITVLEEKHEVTISFTANAPIDMSSLLRELNRWRMVTVLVFVEQNGIRYNHHGHVVGGEENRQ